MKPTALPIGINRNLLKHCQNDVATNWFVQSTKSWRYPRRRCQLSEIEENGQRFLHPTAANIFFRYQRERPKVSAILAQRVEKWTNCEGPGHKKLWSWWPSGQARDSSWTLPLDPFFTPRQQTNFLSISILIRFNSVFIIRVQPSMGLRLPPRGQVSSWKICIQWTCAFDVMQEAEKIFNSSAKKLFNVQWCALTNVEIVFVVEDARFVTHPVGRTWWAGHFPATTLNSKSSKSKEKWIIQSIWPFWFALVY